MNKLFSDAAFLGKNGKAASALKKVLGWAGKN
jgi:predicted RNA-binding protein YlqC (UPF0109 family)